MKKENGVLDDEAFMFSESTVIFTSQQSHIKYPNRFNSFRIFLLLLVPLVMGMKLALYSRDKYVRKHFPDAFFNENNIPNIIWGLTMATFPIGGGIGALSISFFSNTIGRKYTVLICLIIGLIGQTLGFLSYRFEIYALFVTSRFFDGLSSGSSMNVGICYFFELLPSSYVSFSNPMVQFCVNFGLVISGIFSLDKIINDEWILTSVPVIIIQIILLFNVLFLPESPQFVYAKTMNVNYMRTILSKLRGENYYKLDEEISIIVNERSRVLETDEISLWKFLRTDTLLPSIIVMSVIQLSQQLSGVNAIIYYANNFMENSKFSFDDYGVLFCLSLCLFGSAVFIPCISKYSSRSMLLIGYFGMALFFYCSFVAWIVQAPPIVVVFFLGAFLFIFQIGPGPKPWVIIMETYPHQYRIAAQGFFTFLSWFANAIVSIVYMWVSKPLKFYVSLIFGTINLLTFIFLLIFMIDSSKKSPDEIIKCYQNKRLRFIK